MGILIAILIFVGLFAIYDLIRTMNNNIIEQTEEIKKLRDKINQRDLK